MGSSNSLPKSPKVITPSLFLALLTTPKLLGFGLEDADDFWVCFNSCTH